VDAHRWATATLRKRIRRISDGDKAGAAKVYPKGYDAIKAALTIQAMALEEVIKAQGISAKAQEHYKGYCTKAETSSPRSQVSPTRKRALESNMAEFAIHKENAMWKVLLAVGFAGCMGGILNSLLSGTGLLLPRFTFVEGSRVLQPGFLGNFVIGSMAALVSYGLYGPLSGYVLIQGTRQGENPSAAAPQFTLAAFAGAVLVGLSGGRWMTAESERQLNYGTAVATAQAADNLATRQSSAVTSPGDKKAFAEVLQSIQAQGPNESYEQATKLRAMLVKPPDQGP